MARGRSLDALETRTSARASCLLNGKDARRAQLELALAAISVEIALVEGLATNLDWEKRTLLVPLSKSGRPRMIALNAAAIELLRSVPNDPASPYVFPTHLAGLFYPWDRIRSRAGLADVRVHDLRHSFASFLVNQGVSLYVVQGLLGHTQARMTQRYAHLASQTLLNAAEVVSGVIRGAQQAGGIGPSGL